jgi:hypothetical protein
MPEQRPNDGGSYRRDKNGKYVRLDQPQKPHPGTTALRKQAERGADEGATNPPAGKADTKTGKAKE